MNFLSSHPLPKIMGILNITPDSFSDGGKHEAIEAALARIDQMQKEGAAIVDIGAESSRPGAVPLSADQEQGRLQPLLEQLHLFPTLKFSLDSYHLATMKWALRYPIDILNDIKGCQPDPEKREFLKSVQIPYVAMHMQGDPATMQQAPSYRNSVVEIKNAFEALIEELGPEYPLILDPGIGFGKTADHNLEIMKKMNSFHSLAKPLLLGVSRKSLLGHITGASVENRLPASLAAALYAYQQGAAILRVHDVWETRHAIQVMEAFSA